MNEMYHYRVHDPVTDTSLYSDANLYSSPSSLAAHHQPHTHILGPIPAALPATVPVVCGPVRGNLLVARCKVILEPGTPSEREVTPTEFERLGGRAATKKWKQSIRVVNSDGNPGRPIGDWLSSLGLDIRANPVAAAGQYDAEPHATLDDTSDRAAAARLHGRYLSLTPAGSGAAPYPGVTPRAPGQQQLPPSYHAAVPDVSQMPYPDLVHLAAQRSASAQPPHHGLPQPAKGALAHHEVHTAGQAPGWRRTVPITDPAVSKSVLAAYQAGKQLEHPLWVLRVAQPLHVDGQEVTLRSIYHVVQKLGGYEHVMARRAWVEVAQRLGLPVTDTATCTLRNAYQQRLLRYERHELALRRFAADTKSNRQPSTLPLPGARPSSGAGTGVTPRCLLSRDLLPPGTLADAHASASGQPPHDSAAAGTAAAPANAYSADIDVLRLEDSDGPALEGAGVGSGGSSMPGAAQSASQRLQEFELYGMEHRNAAAVPQAALPGYAAGSYSYPRCDTTVATQAQRARAASATGEVVAGSAGGFSTAAGDYWQLPARSAALHHLHLSSYGGAAGDPMVPQSPLATASGGASGVVPEPAVGVTSTTVARSADTSNLFPAPVGLSRQGSAQHWDDRASQYGALYASAGASAYHAQGVPGAEGGYSAAMASQQAYSHRTNIAFSTYHDAAPHHYGPPYSSYGAGSMHVGGGELASSTAPDGSMVAHSRYDVVPGYRHVQPQRYQQQHQQQHQHQQSSYMHLKRTAADAAEADELTAKRMHM